MKVSGHLLLHLKEGLKLSYQADSQKSDLYDLLKVSDEFSGLISWMTQ